MPDVIVEDVAPGDVIVEEGDDVLVIEILIPGPPGAKGDPGDPGEPAALGGSLRSVGGKAEAGGAWGEIDCDDDVEYTVDLAVSNRWIVLLNGRNITLSPTNVPTDPSVSIVVFNPDGGSITWWPGVVWPDPGTPPAIAAGSSAVLTLAFHRLPAVYGGAWLGYKSNHTLP